MTTETNKLSIAVWITAALLSLTATTQVSAKPSVLIIGGWSDATMPLRTLLRDNGFETDSPLEWSKVSPEQLRKYNVVVLSLLGVVNADTPKPTSTQAPPAYFANLAETLVNHAKAGGGVLLLGGLSYNTDWASVELLNRIFKARIGFEYTGYQVVDKEHRYASPPGTAAIDYGFTSDIASHPATKGVRTVFYPI
ncbi:MAG: hypothetical protein L6437_16280, partial [Kiritimatiellae bacterium]|nr:hypothetical protein [Kiritimatiellia bacterium]